MTDEKERPEVVQARNELANALRDGNTDIAEGAAKRLRAMGVDPERRQRAAAARKAAAEESTDDPATARSGKPAGRSTKEGART